MSQDNGDLDVFNKIENFTTFKSPNNFDDYFASVLPTLSIWKFFNLNKIIF